MQANAETSNLKKKITKHVSESSDSKPMKKVSLSAYFQKVGSLDSKPMGSISVTHINRSCKYFTLPFVTFFCYKNQKFIKNFKLPFQKDRAQSIDMLLFIVFANK